MSEELTKKRAIPTTRRDREESIRAQLPKAIRQLLFNELGGSRKALEQLVKDELSGMVKEAVTNYLSSPNFETALLKMVEEQFRVYGSTPNKLRDHVVETVKAEAARQARQYVRVTLKPVETGAVMDDLANL